MAAAGHSPASALGSASPRARIREAAFRLMLQLSLLVSLVLLATLIVDVVRDGLPVISFGFLSSPPSQITPESAGLYPALTGTLWIIGVCALFIVPVGVATAVYLEEYADSDKWWNRLIEVNIQNLAAVPSVVYGILGLAFLVRGPVGVGRVVLAGGLTLALLVLPVVIIAGREAIRAVPAGIREGSLALGATQWQTIWRQVLPAAVPGVATGVILALSRAIGETAPLLILGTAAYIAFSPTGLGSLFTALPLQILVWIRSAQPEFQALAAGGILVLMAVLLAMNAVAIALRNRYEQKW
jgi:phosphate transport system permease protein